MSEIISAVKERVNDTRSLENENEIFPRKISFFSSFFFCLLSSLSVISNNSFKLFSLSGVDKVDEIFSSEPAASTNVKIVERLFSSSLIGECCLLFFNSNSEDGRTISKLANVTNLMLKPISN